MISSRNLARSVLRPLHSFAKKQMTPYSTVTINFVDQEGKPKQVQANVGQSVLEIARENNLYLEGACESSLACSTCHVYVDEKNFGKLPTPSEQEEDMLDLAMELTPLSRLGCQIFVDKSLDGVTFTLPKASKNLLQK